ncbi:30S ribosomal protein S17 [Borrelia hermsii]|uniref:Small ribosomal subunit protein uS17 n=3 Tax=Borrelia hermsii TaxID=140 RepID=RS17_BORHD|nr:30S ribosomal protein S17 [Borrelia hermsii]B2S0J0.1 RecName: Full=Small ribosomal subunit protein uS17; AltName: Full=30S ribosomal protein S17 [Borrelia hermsii DAH]AAX16996.1 SSU ribosomal protein S17P [Borrelia hermsii DAH]AHH12510.1 SSU ribosomal protein S17P [Borrelia hermsii YBT]AJW73288.1 30S ribosomal protein S17 [Borrelia hermsii CC1]AMR75359.1 30S ribosomal protein S17 [Borrelia hermsii]ANA43294.1 30S ribosomal protein S17 [Borrelia hermsii HS1]
MARENKKDLIGKVVSDKMSKTIVVEIVQRKMHPIYHKYLKVSRRVKAHDEREESRLGDKVRIIESRPISKEKRWMLVEILERSK